MLSFKTAATGALLLASSFAWADKTTTFVLDPEHSQVHFQWNHLGFSSPGANFAVVEGEIVVNETRLDRSSVAISIAVDSLNTHVPALNEHLLNGGDFFLPQQHPTITYVSTGISNLDLEEKSFALEGVLSINGIEQPVTLAARVNKVGAHPMWGDAQAIGVDAHTELLRSAFAMDAHVPYVGDELSVNISIEAIEKSAYLAAKAQPPASNEANEEAGSLGERLDKHLNKGKSETAAEPSPEEEQEAEQEQKAEQKTAPEQEQAPTNGGNNQSPEQEENGPSIEDEPLEEATDSTSALHAA